MSYPVLIDRQNQLQDEAKLVIEKLQLQEKLSEIGEIHFVGSYLLGLMTWKDIDIQILNNDFDLNIFWKTARELFETPGFIDMTFQNTLDTQVTDMVAGLYIGMHFTLSADKDPWDLIRNKKDSWKIDLWFTKLESRKTIEDNQRILSQLNDDNKLAILTIKNDIAHLPSYRKSVFSIDIYNAVLEHKVRNTDDFRNYLSSINKTI